MEIVTLVSWAGVGFTRQPGERVTVSAAVGAARIAAGLATPVPGDPAPPPPPARQRKQRAGQRVDTTAVHPAPERRAEGGNHDRL